MIVMPYETADCVTLIYSTSQVIQLAERQLGSPRSRKASVHSWVFGRKFQGAALRVSANYTENLRALQTRSC